jgi:hypothetical protein
LISYLARNKYPLLLALGIGGGALVAKDWHRPMWLRFVFGVAGAGLIAYRFYGREQKIIEAEEQIRSALAHTDRPLYMLELANHTTAPTKHLWRAIDRLEDRGEVEVDVETDGERCLYRLSERVDL